MLKYFIMKQRYSLRSNAVKFRAMALIVIAFVMGGNVVMGADWSPIGTSDNTFIIKTEGTGNQFKVSDNNGSTWSGPYDNWKGINVQNGKTVNIVFRTSMPVQVTGQIKVTNGTINMSLGEGYSSSVTLKNAFFATTYQYQGLIYLPDGNTGDRLTTRQITITGTANNDPTSSSFDASKQFVIDGGCDGMQHHRSNSGNSKGYYYITCNDASKQTANPILRAQSGTLTLRNVTVQNQWNTRGGTGYGAIVIVTNKSSITNYSVKLDMQQCWITKCAGNHYPGVSFQYSIKQYTGTYDPAPQATLNQCKFSECYSTTNSTTIGGNNLGDAPEGGKWVSSNAAIRSVSHSMCNLDVKNCLVEDNYGGGIRWQSVGVKPMLVENCTIQRNWTPEEGGGMLIKAGATIKNCQILNDTALKAGGGIFYTTFEETFASSDLYNYLYNNLTPREGIVTLDVQTNIKNNYAGTDGGGIAIYARKIQPRTKLYYYSYDEFGNETTNPLKVELRLEGATIQDNYAGRDGGGVFISRDGAASFYPTTCNLLLGNIYKNTAGGNGGGAYIGQTQTPVGTSDLHPIQPIVVKTGESTGKMVINQDTANLNGGGVYVYVPHSTDPTLQVPATIELLTNTYIANNIATTQNGGGIYVEEGDVRIKSTFIGVDTSNASGPNKALAGSGGGVYLNTGSITMLSTMVQHNIATGGHGGGIYLGNGDISINPNEIGTGTRSNISYNKAGKNGGGIYNASGKLIAYGSFAENNPEDYQIQVTHNKADSSGGGIYCKGNTNPNSGVYDIRLRRVRIGYNKAGLSGGGIYLDKGKISIINGIIECDTAAVHGGGVYTNEGDIDINVTRDERQPSRIVNNTAGVNGGGLNTHHGYIRVFGNDKDQRIFVANNKAKTGSGGGIFCMGKSESDTYITMEHTDLINNKAVNGGANAGDNVVAGCGGGMYLQKGRIVITDVNIQNNYAKNNGGGINNHEGNIDVDGCYIGSSHSESGDHYYKDEITFNPDNATNDTDRGNEAGNNGGGIYTHKGDIDIEDYIEISGHIFREESKITFNKAGKNGGGINTHQGIIYINKKEQDDQIEISFNKANKGGGMYANAGTIIAYNAIIHDNTATQNGGGANNHSGDIIFYGGSLSNNTAEKGHGGGAYTNVGDIDLFQFPSNNLMNPTLNDGMKVYNNIAKMNGGAFNNHTGRVDVRHATLYNNTATLGNGGAIFCEGPHANPDKGLGYTIRLLCSDMVQNKTRGQDGTASDPTGRGGGIYLKYGSIYSHYSNILNNSANINGGGIDNHSGNILLYGCNVQENQAVTGSGGGIFTYTGDITIGPSTARDGLYNTSKPTIIDHNTAQQDGGGINNQQGNITINGDIVANNEAVKGNGGGVYIADGIINMNGGRIDYNKADQGQGGGVWSGGGEFNIMERDATPEPITLIVDSEVKRNVDQNGNVIPSGEEGAGQTATIHYHLVDQGKYSGVTDVAHGIIWGEGSPNIEVVYGSTSGTAAGYTYKQGEPACQRITIPAKSGSNPGIEPGKTYYAKAFFRYKSIDGDPVVKTGYSETIEFVTFSSSPLVLSGTVGNITSNSAQGSGKIMDPGDTPITERGVQIWTGSSTPPSSLTEDNKRPSQDETDFFTVDLRKKEGDTYVDLNPNTTYYARAYATNSHGTSYGNTVEFKTLKNTPDMGNNPVIVTTEIVNGVIVATAEFSMPTGTTFGGENGVKAFGFVWSTDDDPELLQDHTVQCSTQSSMTNDTTFKASYSPVRPNLTFYVRAYASYIETSVTPTSDITNFSVSEATQHISPSLDGSPVVRANSISGITQNGANIHGQLHYEGSSAVTEYGVVYSPNIQEPAIPTGTATDPKKVSVSGSPGTASEFTVPISGLTPGTTYYLRVYAVNAADTAYSNNFNFTALPVTQPNVVGEAIHYYDTVGHIDHTKVDVVSRIQSDGGADITHYGINYGSQFTTDAQGNIVPNFATGTNIDSTNVAGISSEGLYTITIHPQPNGLIPHTNYWVNSYATNEANLTHTCQWFIFTTNYDKPSVVLDSITNLVTIEGIENNPPTLTGTGNYTVTLAGSEVKTHGVCWSTFHNPTRNQSDVANTHFRDGTGTISTNGPGSATMNQRFPNMKYYARAYVSTNTPNDVIDPDNPQNNTYSLNDIVYCNDERAFLTLPIMQSNGASNVTSTSAMLAGTIASRDTEHYLTKYGVCWGTSANPTPNNNPSAPNYLEVDITSASSTTRPFSFKVTGLTPYDPANPQSYHYRAYAINRNGKAGTDFAFALDSIAYGPDVTFTTTQYTITAMALPSTGGTVTGGGGYNAGTNNCTLRATMTSGGDYTFQGWYLNNDRKSTDLEYTFNVTGNADYEARFKSKVTLMAGEHGKVSFTNSGWDQIPEQDTVNGMYEYNASCSAYAHASSGYDFVNWTDGSLDVVSTDNPYNFSVLNVTNLTANFGATRTISVSSNNTAQGSASVNGAASATFGEGAECTVTATAEPSYTFIYWKEGDDVVSVDASYTFTVAENRTLVAYFGTSRTITVSANDPAYGTVDGGGTYGDGGTCTVMATPAEGYVFSNWTENNVVVVDGENNPVPATYTFTVSGNRTLVANFQARRGNATSTTRPRDIYPAPAREPWDWDDDPFGTREGESTVPTVTTGSVTNHTATSATVGGTVTALGSTEGDAALTAAGIWYSEVGNTYDAVSNPGTFVAASSIPNINAAYTVNLTGLTADKIYYARAYAKNNKVDDYGFGDAISIKFNAPTVTTGAVSDITATSATVKGTVTDQGTADVTAAGIWYSDAGPDYSTDNTGIFVAASSTPAINAEYSVELPGTGNPDLDPSKTYYARAYASNATGIYGFGNAVTFSHGNLVIVTGDITDVTASSATVKCTLMSAGTETVSQIGVWYSTEGPVWDGTTNAGVFTEATGTTVGTEYSVTLNLSSYNPYVRAYAKTSTNQVFFGNLATIYTNSPSVSYNTADYGGGIYMTNNDPNNPTVLVFSGGNSDNAKGKINLNYAERLGGGIYIDEEAYMQMTGYCEVNGNRVPADSLGGGIYLLGRLYVGNPGDGATDNSLKVNQNFAINDNEFESHYVGQEDAYTLENKFKRNNIYLPKDTYSYATGNNTSTDDHSNVITLLADISAKIAGTSTYYSNMGFSVPHGYCPVITTAATFGGDYLKQGDENFSTVYERWMSNLMPSYGGTAWSNSALFDDSESHIAIHTETDIDPFRAKYIFLWGSWTNPKVDEDPEKENQMAYSANHTHYNITYSTNPLHPEDENKKIANWEIYSPEGLSWFSSYINGLNAFTSGDIGEGGVHKAYDPDVNPYATAKLMNDIDMSAAFWVPLGSVTTYDGSVYHDDENNEHTFKGTFNGQGYIITGLDCRFLTGVRKYGLFGKLNENAMVKNVFIDDSKYMTIDEQAPYYVGGVAGILSGGATISASEARVEMDVNKADKTRSYVGGLVGKTEGTTANPSIIHSSMAMPEIIGTVDNMGGLVGYLNVYDSLLNSFSNPKFDSVPAANKYIGGLVGVNNGLVENCYARLRGTEQPRFGWLAGTNNGTINYSYALKPETGTRTYIANSTSTAPTGHGTYSVTERYSKKYGFKHRDHQMEVASGTTNPYIIAKTNDTLIGGLMHALNHWVDTANKVTTTYAKWTRTMASPINDDYPIPVLTDFNSVGSKDGIYLLYEDNINHMWTGGKKFDTVTALHNPNAAMYLYDVQPGDTPDTVKITGNTAVRLYINEEIGITQPANAVLTARAGVTIKNDRKGSNDQTDDPNWHLFSSAINEVPIGLDYHTTEVGYEGVSDYYVLKNFESAMRNPPAVGSGKGIKNTYYWNRTCMDPPKTTWFQSDDNTAYSYNETGSQIGYFPTNTPYGTWRDRDYNHTSNLNDNGVGGFFDLYCYSEDLYHWVNFKREGKPGFYDHWHMDASNDSTHEVLPYQNELTMPKGKGYMMALSSESMMMADGELNTGDVYTYVTVTPLGTNNPRPSYRYDEPWRMLNMIGNPYQSYLDFEKFVNDTRDDPNSNSDLLYCNSYATRDDKAGEFIFYTMEQSRNNRELMASQYIHPHQGFFVKAKIPGYLKFTDAMRVAGTNISLGSDFRDINYPLVNLICYEPSGHRDFTTVEVNRPELGGGSKMQNLRTGYASIYAHFEDNDYQTLFTPMGVSTVPVWFETEEDGVFTLRWNTLHGNFNYLHLIDHIMGTDIDCLTTDEYIFEAKTSDYKSRFRLVFDCVGVEEYEEDDLNSATFAFQMGDELVINGEGMLQMFDISGRCLMSTQTMGQQSSVSLPKTAAGLYLLRLTTNSQVKVQKMVIK